MTAIAQPTLFLLLLLAIFVPFAANAQWYESGYADSGGGYYDEYVYGSAYDYSDGWSYGYEGYGGDYGSYYDDSSYYGDECWDYCDGSYGSSYGSSYYDNDTMYSYPQYSYQTGYQSTYYQPMYHQQYS